MVRQRKELPWRRRVVALAALLVVGLTAPSRAADVTQQRLEAPEAEPQNWLHHHQNYAGHRFADLSQINAQNVRNLKLTGMVLLGGQQPALGGRQRTTRLEGTPIVEDGFLYVTDGWGAVYKIDARSGQRLDIVWKFDPLIDKVWAGDVACCGVNNRGVALWKDLVISIALDGRMFALRKDSGQEVWERRVADPAVAETLTAAPLIVRDLAIVGPAGAEYGIRGFLEATDLNRAAQAWKTYTIPGKGEPGNETWLDPYNAWETGGGSIWVTGTYDPKLDLMYWGTGNPAPQVDAQYRPGDNLYTNSVLAMDPDDGRIKWYFQYTPNDPFDFDEVSEHTLIDIAGRSLALHAARNGHMYGFDRSTGQFQFGVPYVNLVTWTPGIDPKTGRPLSYNPNAALQDYAGTVPRRGQVGIFCPALQGGKNWEPSTYMRSTQTLYVPSTEGCSAFVAVQEGHFEGKLNGTVKKRTEWDGREPAPAGTPTPIAQTRWSVSAIDPMTGRVRTKVMNDNRTWGLVSTAGNLVFGGNQLGDVFALDGNDLRTLWSFNVGTSIQGPPISFAVNDKQYIAIMAGGLPGASQRNQRPSTQFFTPSNLLLVFGL